jgi:hypothetical protein
MLTPCVDWSTLLQVRGCGVAGAAVLCLTELQVVIKVHCLVYHLPLSILMWQGLQVWKCQGSHVISLSLHGSNSLQTWGAPPQPRQKAKGCTHQRVVKATQPLGGSSSSNLEMQATRMRCCKQASAIAGFPARYADGCGTCCSPC